MMKLLSKRKTNPFIVITAAMIIFVCFGVINNALFSRFRFDLTANNIYTVSPGTKHILKKLEEPIHIRFFYSRKLAVSIPMVQAYANRTIELLKKYVSLSQNRITLEIIDPDSFSKEEDQALAYGIQPVPLSDNGDKLYFGIALSNSSDDIKTIPFLDPQRENLIEYDLIHTIYQLSLPTKLTVGILSPLSFEKPQNQPLSPSEDWTFIEKIKEQYNVKILNPATTSIDSDINLLVVVHPSNASEKMQYAIDQFVLRGGKTMIFVDPYLELPGIKNTKSDLPILFKHWGVQYNSEQVILDGANAVQVPIQDRDTALQRIDKLNWLRLGNIYLNPKETITAKLNVIHYISGGTLLQEAAKENSTIPSFTPLISTSDQAMGVNTPAVLNPQELLKHYVPENKAYPLAAHLSGNATSAFPNNKDKDHIATAKEPIHVMIVGDVDMLRDQFWMQKQQLMNQPFSIQIADNISFLINTLDAFSGGDDLISLRSKNLIDRPFLVVNRLRQKADARFLEEEELLKEKLRETDAKLVTLQQTHQEDGSLSFSPEQEQEINNFRQEIANTRAQLREVQHHLEKNIEHLGSFLKFIHIALIPMLVVLLGLFMPSRLGIKRS